MKIKPKKAILNKNLTRPNPLESNPRNSEAIWLDKNENLDPKLLKLSTKILKTIPSKTLGSYPETGRTYTKLAKWVGVGPENLILTPGSDGVIKMTFEAFVNPGDTVVHSKPTFAMYEVYCKIYGAKNKEIEYLSSQNGPYLNIAKLFDSLKNEKPKLICLPNPDSPTGSILNPDLLKELLTACSNSGTVLLIDEAYHPFYDWTAVNWINHSKNLIIARTFSKAWGLAGLRIGYAIGHHETIDLLHKIKPMYETSTLAIEFINRILNHTKDMEDSVYRILEGKKFFHKEMERLGFKTLNTEGNFIHVDFGKNSSVIHKALEGTVLYRKSFNHISLKGYSRFSVAPKSIMRKVVKLIKRSMELGY